MTTAWAPPAWAAELGVSTPEEYERLTAGMTPSALSEEAPAWAQPELPDGRRVPEWAASAGCQTVEDADALAAEIAESAGLPAPRLASGPETEAPAVAPVVEEEPPPVVASGLSEVDELRLRALARKAKAAASGSGAPLSESEAATLVRIAYEVAPPRTT